MEQIQFLFGHVSVLTTDISDASRTWRNPFRHTYRSLLDETGAPIGVQQMLMRHSNVSTTMNVYGNSTLRAKQQANSKVVQMVIPHEPPHVELEQMAV